MVHVGLLLSLFFGPEDVGDMLLRNVRRLSTDCKSYIRKLNLLHTC
jgi:hypothetical protein